MSLINVTNFAKLMVFIMLLGLLPALVFEKYVAKSYVHVVLLMGFGFMVYWNYKKTLFSSNEETLIRYGLAIFMMVLMGFFQQMDGLTRFDVAIDSYIKVLFPLALLPLFYWIKLDGFKFIILSLFLACTVAFGVAVVGLIQELPRGGGELHGSAIIYGDLSMLFGLLSGVFAMYFHLNTQRLLSFLFVALCFMGVVASLLSGTKGGLIALLSLPILVYSLLAKPRTKIIFILLVVLLIAVISLLFSVTDSIIKQRLILAWQEIGQILNGDFQGASLGYRIQIWIAAIYAFMANPVFGIGAGEFYAFKSELVQAGLISVNIERFKHAHNEYLTVLSNFGLVGVLVYILFFKWLISVFYKATQNPHLKTKYLGFSGLVMIMCYFDFSLSESFLSSQLGASAFFFITTLFIYTLHTVTPCSTHIEKLNE